MTERRGGLRDPALVPLGLLVALALFVATLPLQNAVSRRYEAEADWIALRATGDPDASIGLDLRLAQTSLGDPDPPAWAKLFLSTHPPTVERIAMAEALPHLRSAPMTSALERLERELAAAADAPVTLERPREAAHGDYATNVALRAAPARGLKPMELAEELARAAGGLEGVRRAEAAPPGFVNLELETGVVLGRPGGDPARGRRVRAGRARPARAHPGRARLGQSDRADHRGDGAKRGVRRLGRAPPRVRGARGRARVLRERRGRADRPVPGLGRGAGAGGGAARGRLPGRVPGGAREARGRPGRGDARGDSRDARAVPRRDRDVHPPERGRAGARGRARRAPALRVRGRAVGADDALGGRQGSRRRPLGRPPDLLRRRRRLPAAQARAAASTG